MKNKIIPFGLHERLLNKARAYVHAPDRVSSESQEAVTLLLQALKIGDEDLKLKIVLVLGTVVRPQVVRLLYKLMHDRDESESIRYAAAVQLSVLGGMLELPDLEQLVRQLKNDLGHADPFVRASAVLALGWEDNQEALPQLIERLWDPDPDVAQAAVNTLAIINGERLFELLVERLTSCTKHQKRCILYALDCFHSHREHVIDIYAHYMQDADPDVRYDVLLAFDPVGKGEKHLHLLGRALQDEEARIRELALTRLLSVREPHLEYIEALVRPLLQDPQASVRRAAVKLMHQMRPKPTAA